MSITLPKLPAYYIARILKVLVVLVPLVLASGLRDYTLVPKLLFLQLVLLFMLIVWLLDIRRSYVSIPSLSLPAIAYVCSNLVSVLYGNDPLAGLQEANKLFSGFLLFTVIANRIHQDDIQSLFGAIVLGSILITILGIGQHAGWLPFSIPSAGLPSATLGFRNFAATYLIQTIPLAIVLLFRTHSLYSWLSVLSLSGALAFLYHTRTRGAWIGLAFAALLVAILIWSSRGSEWSWNTLVKSKLKQIAVLVPLVLVLSWIPSAGTKVGPQSIDEKKSNLTAALVSISEEGGDRGRIVMWKHTLEMAYDNLLFGVGLGNWAVHYPKYDGGDRITIGAAPERPHNDLFWILAEVGILGFLCYTWLGKVVLQSARRCFKSHDPETRWIAIGCLTSLAAVAGHSCFSFPRERITPTVFFWLCLGFLAVVTPGWKRVRFKAVYGKIAVAILLLLSACQLAVTQRILLFEEGMFRAVVAEKRGNWDSVESETKKALNIGSLHAEAIHLRGYSLNRLGKFKEATEHYQSALSRRPYDISVHNGLAIALQNLGQFEYAENHYLIALDLIPGIPDIHYNLAGLYFRMRAMGQAATEYEKVMVYEEPSVDLCIRLGTALTLSGQLQEGKASFKYAAGIDTENGFAHIQLVEQLYLQHQDEQTLIQFYRTFLENWNGDLRIVAAANRRMTELLQKDNR